MVAYSNVHEGQGGGAVRTGSGAGVGVSVILCTTEDDEPLFANIVDRLHREGLSPGIVAGVDVDTQKLGNHLDYNDDPSVYVLCVSRNLSPNVAGRLEGVFAVRQGPMHRCVTVDFAAGDHEGALREIRAAAADLAFGGGGPSEKPDDETLITQSRARDVIDPDVLRAVTTPTASRVLGSGDVERVDESTPHEVEISVETRRQVVENVKAKVQAKVSPLTETSEIPVATGMEPASPPPRQRSAGAIIGLVIGGLVLVGVGVALAILQPWATSEPEKTPEKAPRKAGEGAGARPEGAEASPSHAPGPSVPGTSPDAAQDAGADDDPGTADPAASGPLSTDSEAVREAIKGGDMRALDLLLALEQSGSMTWLDARDHCTEQRVAGFDDWRMPSSKELWKLRNARILNSREAYWSSTADASEDAEPETILGVDHGKVATLQKVDDQPHVVCVRKR